MIRLTCDWNPHSHHSPCGDASSTMDTIIARAAGEGITDFGVTDHSHAMGNDASLRASREEFDQAEKPDGFHFGVEASCLRRYDIEREREEGGTTYGVRAKEGPEGDLALYLTDALIDELGVEYVVAGAHWPLGCEMTREAVIRNYFAQNMFLAAHPLVDVVAHTWWWMGEWRDADGVYRTRPWLDDFGVIPQSMHDEFAAALIEHGTLMEINGGAMLLTEKYPMSFRRQYGDYLVSMKERGVRFSFGSDCHGPASAPRVRQVEPILDGLGITAEDLHSPLSRSQ